MKVIVTGASRGIGRGIAQVLAKRGHHLGLLARSEEALAELAQNIIAAGGVAHATPADLRNHDDVAAAFAALIEQLNGVDALINNAGVVIRQDVCSISLADWHAMIETNINGLFYATRAVIPQLRQQGRGHIINVSSISGRWPLRGGSGYAATKHAVVGFSESMFLELREFGIKVSTIFPGSVDTTSHREDDGAGHWKVTPEEVGEACASLLETSATNCISQLEIRPLRKPAE